MSFGVYILFFCGLFNQFEFAPGVKVNTGPGDSQMLFFGPTESTGQRGLFARGDTVYATWKEEFAGDEDIYFAKSIDAGFSFGEPVRVDDIYPDTFHQNLPGIFVDNLGVIYIIWRDWSYGSNIRLSKSIDGGLSFGNSVLVNDSLPVATRVCPSIWVFDNTVYAVWHDGRNGNMDIYFEKSEGVTFPQDREDVRVDDDTSGTAFQGTPVISVAPNGDIYVVWADMRGPTSAWDIYFAKSIDGGNTWIEHKRVDDSGSGDSWQLQPTMTIDSFGNIYVAWADSRNVVPWNVYFSMSTDGGDSFSPNVKVDALPPLLTGGAVYPSITLGSDSLIYIVWADDRAGQFNIYFSWSDDGGLTFADTSIMVDGSVGTTAVSANVAANGDRVYVLWSDNRDYPGTLYKDVYFS